MRRRPSSPSCVTCRPEASTPQPGGRKPGIPRRLLRSRHCVTKRGLAALPDGELDDRCEALYQLGLNARPSNEAEAARVGLRAAEDDTVLGPLLSAITAYAAVVHNPTGAVKKRANATPTAIDAELRRMQSVFRDELDPLIPQFEEDDADFVANYRRLRQQVTQHKKKDEGDKGDGTKTSPTGGG